MIGTFKTMLALLACVCATVLVFHERLQAYSLTFAAAGATQKRSQGAGDSAAKAHIPPMGSPERKAIMDALRGDQKVIFKVHYLKVHGDWAWVDVTPLDDKGKPVAEGGPSLMHKENSAWKVMDLSIVPEDPDQPLEAEDTPPEFVKKLQAVFPGVPADIFPHRARAK